MQQVYGSLFRLFYRDGRRLWLHTVVNRSFSQEEKVFKQLAGTAGKFLLE